MGSNDSKGRENGIWMAVSRDGKEKEFPDPHVLYFVTFNI